MPEPLDPTTLATRVAAARALADQLRETLAPYGADATTIATEVSSLARHGVAFVQPPRLEFPTMGTDFDAEWPVHLIAGPARDYHQAWAIIDGLLEALLAAGFPITKAEPASFQPQQGEALPAYTITITG